jgi:hypothetical protein
MGEHEHEFKTVKKLLGNAWLERCSCGAERVTGDI